jgi:putative FmdB family regulatory protein
MPLYDYRCPECKRVWEELRKPSELDTPAVCPDCLIPGKRVFSGNPRTMWFPGSTRTFVPSEKERKHAADRHE